MARKQRIEFAGGVFHVWARRVDRWPLFVDEDDYRRYVALLAQTVERFDWAVLTFCLMPNHIHLVVQLREANLARGMHWLHLRYARHFNDRHGREGRLFEHRYGSRVVADDVYFATVMQYVEQNPVRAMLSETPAGWPWSARGMTANGAAPSWLARRREPKDAT